MNSNDGFTSRRCHNNRVVNLRTDGECVLEKHREVLL
jgi:hypothetical protein